jgi:hypothetical protein
LTLQNLPLDDYEIEARLHSILGRFFVAVARIELNLSLRVGGDGSFSEKLERLLDAAIEFEDSEDAFCEILAWYMAADAIRKIRNLVAHGRWGFHVQFQQVAHVSGYPPGPQEERRFSLGELDAFVQDAERLGVEVGRLPVWQA